MRTHHHQIDPAAAGAHLEGRNSVSVATTNPAGPDNLSSYEEGCVTKGGVASFIYKRLGYVPKLQNTTQKAY